MTKSENQNPPQPKPRVENPIQRIPFNPLDVQGVVVRGGSKPLKGVEVDGSYRQNLANELVNSWEIASQSLVQYPGAHAALVFRLHERAIAKTHRPLHLISRASAPLAGHANLDEMLVGLQPIHFETLRRLVLSDATQKTIANLSAISSIETWSKIRRNPSGIKALRESGRAILIPFGYASGHLTQENYDNLESVINKLNIPWRVLPGGNFSALELTDLDRVKDDFLEVLLDHPGLRSLEPTPFITSISAAIPKSTGSERAFSLPLPADDLPVVAIFDTGINPKLPILLPWIKKRETFVIPPDTNYVHGTAVASLVAAGQLLNNDFPSTPCLIFDIAGLETNGAPVSDLMLRLEDVVRKNSNIKIWNLSLNATPCEDQRFSEFAQLLDSLSLKHNVLFVVSAGNYSENPRRGWPISTHLTGDRISTPSESPYALTVGSIAQEGSADTLVQAQEPAPYSRRGPGPVFTSKPDVVHWGGNLHHPFEYGSCSSNVLSPNGEEYYSAGTSFSAPIVSALCAHTWRSLEGHKSTTPSPPLVKAAVIHAAQLGNPSYGAMERQYYGSGMPPDVMTALYDRDDSFTLLFEADLAPGALRWRKAPFPIPECLKEGGRLRSEVIITAVYTPDLDPNFGAEYIRSNLELSFGILDGDRISGQVPQDIEPGLHTYEEQLVKNGAKWSPVKIHRASFPVGVAGDVWALQAKLSLRAGEPMPQKATKVYIFVTLRSVDGNLMVQEDGMKALKLTQWAHNQLPVSIPVYG